MYEINFEKNHPISTPMEYKLSTVFNKNPEICYKPYKQLVGCLMYVMFGTRPDLCLTISSSTVF